MTGLRKQISDAVAESGWPQEVAEIINKMWRYGDSRNKTGMCHVFASVLYVALSEVGFSPELYIGECGIEGIKPFDHSWITLDDKIIDVAIDKPMTPFPVGFSGVGPIVGDIDVSTGCAPLVKYGVQTAVGFGLDVQHILGRSFNAYMDQYPGECNGCWTVVGRVLNKPVDVQVLRNKYADTKRIIYRVPGSKIMSSEDCMLGRYSD